MKKKCPLCGWVGPSHERDLRDDRRFFEVQYGCPQCYEYSPVSRWKTVAEDD